MIFKFTEGCRLKADPQTVGEFLEKLEKKNGQLNSKIVLKAARPKSSPLHEEFDWDDEIAAEKWRDSQAQYVLRSVVAVMTLENGEERVVRAFVNVGGPGQGHTSITTVLASPELTEKLLDQALRELRGWHCRYEVYRELSHLCGVVDRNLRAYEDQLLQHTVSSAKERLHAQT